MSGFWTNSRAQFNGVELIATIKNLAFSNNIYEEFIFCKIEKQRSGSWLVLRSYYNSAIKELVELPLFHSHPLFRSSPAFHPWTAAVSVGRDGDESIYYSTIHYTGGDSIYEVSRAAYFPRQQEVSLPQDCIVSNKSLPTGYLHQKRHTYSRAQWFCPVQTHFLHATTKFRKSRYHSSYVSKTY